MIEVSPDQVQHDRGGISPVPFAIASGMTVLLGGGTIALAAIVNSKKDEVASPEDADSANKLRKIGVGTLIGTAGAGVTALVLAIFTDFKRKPKSTPVSVYGAPNEGGFVISGSF